VSWSSASVAKSRLLPLGSLQETRQLSGGPWGREGPWGGAASGARAVLHAAVGAQPRLPCVGRRAPKCSHGKIRLLTHSTVWLSRQEW